MLQRFIERDCLPGKDAAAVAAAGMLAAHGTLGTLGAETDSELPAGSTGTSTGEGSSDANDNADADVNDNDNDDSGAAAAKPRGWGKLKAAVTRQSGGTGKDKGKKKGKGKGKGGKREWARGKSYYGIKQGGQGFAGSTLN